MNSNEKDIDSIQEVTQKEILQKIRSSKDSITTLLKKSNLEDKDYMVIVEILDLITYGLEDDDYELILRKEAIGFFAEIGYKLKSRLKREGYHDYLIGKLIETNLTILEKYQQEHSEIISSAIKIIDALANEQAVKKALPIIEKIVHFTRDAEILYPALNFLWYKSLVKPLNHFVEIFKNNEYPINVRSNIFGKLSTYLKETKEWTTIQEAFAHALQSKNGDLRYSSAKLFFDHGHENLYEDEIKEALQKETDEGTIEALILALKTVGTIKSYNILQEKRQFGNPRISTAANTALTGIANRSGYESDTEHIYAIQPKRITWVEHLRSIAVVISLIGISLNIYFNIHPIENVTIGHYVLQWSTISISIIFLLVYCITTLISYTKLRKFKKKIQIK